jgi:hypothetical protein
MIRSTLSLSFVLLAAPALAGNPDQVNEGPLSGGTSIGVIGSSFSQSAAQTITVGIGGRLDHVHMYVYAGGALSNPLVLEIHSVSGGLPADEVLATRSMTVDPIGLQWVIFDFSVIPVTVTQGQQLALVLRSNQDLSRGGEYDAEGSHDVYAGGASFVRNSGGPWTLINDYDLMFRTYVFPTTGTCCDADYDGDGDPGTDFDIEAFFACLAGSCCGTCPPDADFNCDGDVGTDGDIASFFRVLAGGAC